MKKMLLTIACVVVLACSLTACSMTVSLSGTPELTTVDSKSDTTTTVVESETETTTTTTTTTIKTTTTTTTTTAAEEQQSTSYLHKLYSGEDIYVGPGFAYDVASVLQEDGTFTIVEESWDASGNRWGKLKSGAGWVVLHHSEITMRETPYLLQLNSGKWIYTGPGRDYDMALILEESGTFTIVEECWDTSGNLWGRLKSGVGWVNLTSVYYNE